MINGSGKIKGNGPSLLLWPTKIALGSIRAIKKPDLATRIEAFLQRIISEKRSLGRIQGGIPFPINYDIRLESFEIFPGWRGKESLLVGIRLVAIDFESKAEPESVPIKQELLEKFIRIGMRDKLLSQIIPQLRSDEEKRKAETLLPGMELVVRFSAAGFFLDRYLSEEFPGLIIDGPIDAVSEQVLERASIDRQFNEFINKEFDLIISLTEKDS